MVINLPVNEFFFLFLILNLFKNSLTNSGSSNFFMNIGHVTTTRNFIIYNPFFQKYFSTVGLY